LVMICMIFEHDLVQTST